MTRHTAITVIRLDPPNEREDEWNDRYTYVHAHGRFKHQTLKLNRFARGIVPS